MDTCNAPAVANLRHYIDPGEMDSRVTIQTASGSPDGYGQVVDSWVDIATLWAKVEWPGMRESEGEDAGQIAQSERVVFTLRYTEVRPKDRISFEGDYYDIKSVAQVGGRKRFMKLSTVLWDSNPV